MMLSIALVIAVAVVAALPSANTALCYLLASAVTFATISGCVYKWRQEKRVSHAARTAPALLLGDEAPPLSDSQTWPPPLTTTPGRVDYLDRLKTALTALVVAHHCTCAFVGSGWYVCLGDYPSAFSAFGRPFLLLNQSYFMCLFFLVSGYFAAASLDKKGRAAFFVDRPRAPPSATPSAPPQRPLSVDRPRRATSCCLAAA